MLIGQLPNPILASEWDAKLRPIMKLISKRASAGERDSYIQRLKKYGRVEVLRELLEDAGADSDTATREETDVLGGVLSQVKLVEATNCRIFAFIDKLVIPADSPKLKSKIAYLFNQKCGGRIGSTSIETALAPLLGANIPHTVVPIRYAWGTDGDIWVDLGGEPRKFANIKANGVKIADACPVPFYRPVMMAPMPTPAIPADDAECKAVFDDAQRHFQIDRQQLASSFAWSVGIVRPGEPPDGGKLTEYLVVLITGPQGSGKTTFADSWSQTVDPKVTPHFKLPRDDEALAILAENTRSLVFNNLSYIPQWTSDALCELADGSGMVLRSLYTSRDTTVFLGSNAVMLVSIGDVALAPDLLDRSLTVELPERSEYLEPEQVEAAFQTLRPRLLGALLYCASRALRDSAGMRAPKGVRMAGAARWALAAAGPAGFTVEEISTAFTRAIKDADDKIAEQPVVTALGQVVRPSATWTGTTGELLTELTEAFQANIPETGTPTKKLPKGWPQTAQALRSALRKLAKTLTRAGVTFVWPASGGRGRRVLTITRDGTEGAIPTALTSTRASGMGVDDGTDWCAVLDGAVPAHHPEVTDPSEPQAGTMGTMPGTMAASEASHRSQPKARGRNDGNDGNDAFLLLAKEEGERVSGELTDEQRGTSPGARRERVQIIVPIVPIVPASEKQGGTMPARVEVGSFPHRSNLPANEVADLTVNITGTSCFSATATVSHTATHVAISAS